MQVNIQEIKIIIYQNRIDQTIFYFNLKDKKIMLNLKTAKKDSFILKKNTSFFKAQVLFHIK